MPAIVVSIVVPILVSFQSLSRSLSRSSSKLRNMQRSDNDRDNDRDNDARISHSLCTQFCRGRRQKALCQQIRRICSKGKDHVYCLAIMPLMLYGQRMNGSSECRASRVAAFTLVEIMIVVAIIGLLAAIAIPSFQKARETSQLNACLNDLRIYQDALAQYAFANAQYPDDISDLVTQGHLEKLYECAVGGAYGWSVSGGNQRYHLRCSGQHTSSINHVCIHENQTPQAK